MTLLFLMLGCTTEELEIQTSETISQHEPTIQHESTSQINEEAMQQIKTKHHPNEVKRVNNQSKDTTKSEIRSTEETHSPTEPTTMSTDLPVSEIPKDIIQTSSEQEINNAELVSKTEEQKEEVRTIVPEKTKKKKKTYAKPNPQCTHKIKKVLRKKKGEILFCYDQQVVKRPDLEGKITVQINVHQTQNSIWVKKDTLKDKGLRSCIKNKIRRWKFGSECHGTSFRKSYSLVAG